MLRLDKNRPFGKISPPYMGDDVGEEPFDRPAHFEQAGALFDAHGRQIIRGKPLPPEELDAAEPDEDEPVAAQHALPPRSPNITDGLNADVMTPATLLRFADELTFAAFKKRAQAILGPECPGSKKQIVAALEEAIKAYEKRLAKRNGTRTETSAPKNVHAGMSWDGMTGNREAEKLAEPQPEQPAPTKGGIDLAAWGRGQKDYLFGDIVKAIRTEYHVQINAAKSGRRDAVNFLIDQGVIQAQHARQDV